MSAEAQERGVGRVETLNRRFPGRKVQIKALADVLLQPGQSLPALIHLYDPNCPDSTLQLLREVIASPTIVVEIDPLVCSTSRSLFTHVWDSLSKAEAASVPAHFDDSLDQFLGFLTRVVEGIVRDNGKLIFIIHRAERMRDIWPEPLMEAVYSMAETIHARGHFTLVTISSLAISHFRMTRGVGLDDALVVPFPRLTKAEALASLELDAENLIKSDKRHTETMSLLVRLHSTYVAVAYDSFAGDIRDLGEIRLLACCVWYPFIEPVLQGAVPVTKLHALLTRGSYLFRDALSRLYTREVGPSDWINQMVARVKLEWQDAEEATLAATKRPRPIIRPIILPTISSFLLLASFLASYNPARLDVRYFVRDESALLPEGYNRRTDGHPDAGKKKRRIGKRKGGGVSGGSRNRQEMLGPKTFALDRLLSIFQSLMTEAGPEVQTWMGEDESQAKSDLWEAKSKSVVIMENINSLIRMNFLVRVGAVERLEGTTLFRTNVIYDAISQVSQRARFDLAEWLWDWNQ
ncbi:hypothetical protein CBS101457_000397 [Exobasidium rhododendri]|nr:hypothetical protein CBS101457_000397 [Exobasidium rhododendri]